MTKAESILWYYLKNKNLGVKFRRQQPIEKYIVDFVSFENKLIIEIDGGQHFNNKYDEARDGWFNDNGYKILRFWNNEVMENIEGVAEKILDALSPSPGPSRQGRGK